MIQNYIKPQSRIRQNLEVLRFGSGDLLNAIVYGPHYKLFRYTDEDEKKELPAVTFKANGQPQTLQYGGEPVAANEEVDTDFVRVFYEDLELVLETGLSDFKIPDLAEPNKIQYTPTGTITTLPQISNSTRDIKPGDYVTVTDGFNGTSTETRKIVRIENGTDGTDDAILVLDGAATTLYLTEATWSDESLTLDVFARASGEFPEDDFTANASDLEILTDPEITVEGGASIVPKDGVGTVFVHFRKLIKPSATEEIKKISSRKDITDNFGKIDMDNILAYGLSVALRASQGKDVFAARVPGNDREDYEQILNKLSKNRNYYTHVPLSYDLGVQRLIRDHVEEMSTWDVKKWRRTYVPVEDVGPWPFLQTGSDDLDLEAIVDTNGNLELKSGNADFVLSDVKTGDLVRTDFSGGEHSTEFTIRSVVGPKTLLLESGPDTAIDTPQKIEIWKGDTAEGQVEFAVRRAQSLDSRRAVAVWTDDGRIYDSDGTAVKVPNLFLAAEIAGLRAAAAPHQGLTKTEIESITTAPLMHNKYTDAQLNKAAENGVMVITQEIEDGPVFIRHQLTTETDKGVLYYEDSVGTNVDEISMRIDDVIDGYIGVVNATSGTIRNIRNEIDQMLYLKTHASPFTDLGPQITEYNKTDMVVEVDPVMRDRINVNLPIGVPLPLNQIVVEIFATASI